MRILLATNHLFAWTGSEVSLVTLGAALRAARHEVLIYAPFQSSAATVSELVQGLRVTAALADLPAFAPDAAYTQHHPVATTVRAALPDVPVAHAMLGVLPHLEQPPRSDLGIERFLAISEEVALAASKAPCPPAPVSIFRNLVDDELFDAAPDPRPLARVVCYSYKLRPHHLEALGEAMAVRGLDLVDHRPGRAGATPYRSVPARLQEGEVVVASGRGAIEAMLCARVPLILADSGDDGLVTPENFESLMRTNFSGRTTASRFDARRLGEELDRYRPGDGAELQRLARQHCGLSARREAIGRLFDDLASAPRCALDPARLREIRFESETLELQRWFARNSAAMQRA